MRPPASGPLALSLVPARSLAAALSLVAALLLAACDGGDSGDAPSTEGNEALFTTAGFEEAGGAVADEAGTDAELLSVQIGPGGANFQVREGERARGLLYTGGSLEEVEIEVVGPGSLERSAFPLLQVDPAAIDEIVAGVEEASGGAEVRVTTLTLGLAPPGERLTWTVNATVDDRPLVYTADPDGSNVRDLAGAIERAQKPAGGAPGAP